MGFNLRIADKNDEQLWDSIVHSSIQGTIFHTWKWLKITEKHTKGTFYPLICYNGTVPIGIYPIFYQKVLGIPCVFSPPPATAIPYLGPVIANFDSYKHSKQVSIFKGFQQVADDFIFSKLKSKYTMILLGPSVDPRILSWSGYKLDPLFDYYIDLNKGCDQVWQDFDKDARVHIKKFEHIIEKDPNSIEIIDGTRNDLSELYELLVKRYGEQKRKVTESQEFLMHIFDEFYPDNIKIFIVKHEGKMVNGVIIIKYLKTISFWIGAVKPEIKEIPSNEINHWEGIKWACENNFSVFEEYGAGIERLARSKSKYNPKLKVRFKAVRYSSIIYLWATKVYQSIIRNRWGNFFSSK